jgi:hypothetical protein
MDDSAYNYNPAATIDSEFCLYVGGDGGGNNENGCSSDFNNDGITNASDLILFLSSFGNVCIP